VGRAASTSPSGSRPTRTTNVSRCSTAASTTRPSRACGHGREAARRGGGQVDPHEPL